MFGLAALHRLSSSHLQACPVFSPRCLFCRFCSSRALRLGRSTLVSSHYSVVSSLIARLGRLRLWVSDWCPRPSERSNSVFLASAFASTPFPARKTTIVHTYIVTPFRFFDIWSRCAFGLDPRHFTTSFVPDKLYSNFPSFPGISAVFRQKSKHRIVKLFPHRNCSIW